MFRRFTAAVSLLAIAVSSIPRAHAHCPTFGGGIGIAGPVTAFSAPTLPKKKWSLGFRAEYVNFNSLSAGELERLAMDARSAHSMDSQFVYSLGAAYGVTDDLTVGVSLPYVQRESIGAVHIHGDGGMPMGMVHDLGDSDGLGDLTLFAQYRVVRKLYEGIDAALLVGIKAPTGETRNKSGSLRIETEHQPGSGSWDPIVGLAVSKRFERLSLHASGLYTVATEGSQETDLGDRAQVNLAAAWRMGGKSGYGDCDEIFEYFYPESRSRWLTDLVLELNGQWQEKSKKQGVFNDSWGGTILYASPGARVTFDNRYTASLSVGIPVYQQLNGHQSEVDYRIVAGLAVGF